MFTSSNLNLRYPSQTLRTGLAAIGGLGLFAASIYFFADNAHAESKDSTPTVFSSVFGQRLRLASAEGVNHNTKLLRFELPYPHARCGLPLTSSLLVISWPQGSIFPVARPYTPISSSSQPGFIDLLVKRYPNGKSSTHLHSLERGQSVFFAFRLPGYTWVPNRFDHIVLIAGGAGITPIYQLARGILENPDDQTKITLLFAVNRDDDLVLKKEFDNFEQSFPTRFRAVYTVSNPVEGSSHRKGRVTKDLLQEVLEDSRSKNPQIFLCGPPAMEESLVGITRPFGAGKPGILQELGYEKNQIVRF